MSAGGWQGPRSNNLAQLDRMAQLSMRQGGHRAGGKGGSGKVNMVAPSETPFMAAVVAGTGSAAPSREKMTEGSGPQTSPSCPGCGAPTKIFKIADGCAYCGRDLHLWPKPK